MYRYMYMCAYMYICAYIKSSFPRHDNRLCKINGFAMRQAHELCFGKELYIYVYMCIHVNPYEELFSKS